MRSKKAITKLQTILIIDILIVAMAAAGYFYITSMPGSPLSSISVQLAGLTSDQNVILGQSLSASVNVTNIGSEKGIYYANLTLDGSPSLSKSVSLTSGETQTINFELTGLTEGSHTLKIDGLETAFTVQSTFSISDLSINRTTAKVGEPIGISMKVTNQVNVTTNYQITLLLNGVETQTKSGVLDAAAAATVLFEVIEQNEGKFNFAIGSLKGNFTITPSAPLPKPAEFQISNLTIDPEIGQIGTAINITAKVTNVGEITGDYSASLTINDVTQGSKNVQLAGGESTAILFTVTENVKGIYTVSIGNSTGTFSIQDPSKIKLTNMIVKPYEVWAGQPVTVTAKGTNTGTEASVLPLKLKLDGVIVQTQNLQLAGGADGSVDFTILADPLQAGDSITHLVDVNGMQGGFMVVKNGYHTLNVQITPRGDAKFTITLPSGITEEHTTFWSALLPEGAYTVTMPLTDPTGRITFVSWEDGGKNLAHTINLNSRTTVTATYSGGSSCPSLYIWNGTGYAYVADISNHGWLGYINYLNEDGSITYYRNNPWDYVPINKTQLQPIDGNYNITLIQKYNEIFYLDQAYMLVVDHPADVDVYSTMVEQYLNPDYMGKIYTVSKNPMTPLSAVNEKNQDVLSKISKMDGTFTTGMNGIQSPAWNNITWNRITLNLGNLSDAKQIKLIVKAIVDWGSADDYTTWLNKFFEQTVPNGTQVTPPPYMEVKDANGNWIKIPEDRQIPLPPDGVARTFVVDLTGLFPTNDYSLRISNFWNVTYDYIGIDLTQQQNITVYKIDPQAYAYQSFSAGLGAATGNFTKYGNVNQLVLNQDDEFVIGRQGDAVSLQFSTGNLPTPASGMERDYFFNDACWFKDENGNWGFGFGFTVDPLPFQTMSGFPYPLTESYPNNTEHQNYLQQWNNRIVNPPTTSQDIVATQNYDYIILVIPAIALIAQAIYFTFKRSALRSIHTNRLKRK
jgi:hypothetical protein